MSRRKALRFAASLLTIFGLSVAAVSSLEARNQNAQLTREAAKQLKNPVPFTKTSIARGHALFNNYCTGCHGNDGKAMIDVIANATDLTEPKVWNSGTTEGEIYRSIRDGAGVNMPPFKNQIQKEEGLWHLVNFIRSLWPESLRPKLQEEKSPQ